MNDARIGPYPRFFGVLSTRLGDDRSRHLQFFGELDARMGDLRRADRRRRFEFFAALSPRLETARALERELDRHLARRFNVFDYLSTVEVGLSRIIADLLDPKAKHGQGTLFLRTLLDELNEIRDRPDLNANFSKRRWSRFLGQVVKVDSSDEQEASRWPERRRFTAEFKARVARWGRFGSATACRRSPGDMSFMRTR